MRNDKNEAIALRRNGSSLRLISKKLHIPKSTLSGWFRDLEWSEQRKKLLTQKAQQQARKRMTLMSHKAKKQRQKKYLQRRVQAVKTFPKLRSKSLFINGLIIYWCEGDSKLENGTIRVTNTDPVMISIFRQFLINFLRVSPDKIKAYLILYPDLKEQQSISYWAKNTRIPKQNFYKSHYIKGKHPTKRLLYGICTIVITNRELKELVLTWLQELRKQYANVRE